VDDIQIKYNAKYKQCRYNTDSKLYSTENLEGYIPIEKKCKKFG